MTQVVRPARVLRHQILRVQIRGLGRLVGTRRRAAASRLAVRLAELVARGARLLLLHAASRSAPCLCLHGGIHARRDRAAMTAREHAGRRRGTSATPTASDDGGARRDEHDAAHRWRAVPSLALRHFLCPSSAWSSDRVGTVAELLGLAAPASSRARALDRRTAPARPARADRSPTRSCRRIARGAIAAAPPSRTTSHARAEHVALRLRRAEPPTAAAHPVVRLPMLLISRRAGPAAVPITTSASPSLSMSPNAAPRPTSVSAERLRRPAPTRPRTGRCPGCDTAGSASSAETDRWRGPAPR